MKSRRRTDGAAVNVIVVQDKCVALRRVRPAGGLGMAMSDTLTVSTRVADVAVPDYPMVRGAGCPFAPPPALRTLGASKPVSRVVIGRQTVERIRGMTGEFAGKVIVGLIGWVNEAAVIERGFKTTREQPQ